MKTLKTLSVLFLVSLLTLASCKKDDDKGSNSGPASAVVDGEKLESCGDECISVFSIGGSTSFTFYNSSANTITINMPTDTEAGTYDLSSDVDEDFYASYSVSNTVYSTDTENGEGELVIKSITFDGTLISAMEATFTFTAEDETNGNTISVTEGVINYAE